MSFPYPKTAICARFSHEGLADLLHLSLRVVEPDIYEPRDPPVVQRVLLPMYGTFDPLPDMICWLEALTCQVQEATWWWDFEGPVFAVTSTHRRLIIEDRITGEMLLNVTVFREQLIAALYCALRRFAMSKRYRSVRWEPCGGVPIPLLTSEMIERYIRERSSDLVEQERRFANTGC